MVNFYLSFLSSESNIASKHGPLFHSKGTSLSFSVHHQFLKWLWFFSFLYRSSLQSSIVHCSESNIGISNGHLCHNVDMIYDVLLSVVALYSIEPAQGFSTVKVNGSCNFTEFVDYYSSCMLVSLKYGELPLQDGVSEYIDVYLQVSWRSSYTRAPFKKYEFIKYLDITAWDLLRDIVIYFWLVDFIMFASLWWVVTAQTLCREWASRWV